MPKSSHIVAGLSLALLTLLACGAASAQVWPSRPVRFIVPFSAGGGSDLQARVLGELLYKLLGQRFVIENRLGMGGSVGAAVVAKAAPDGYTILFGTIGPQITNPYLYKELPYDAEKDLAPVVFLYRVPNVLVVNPAVPARNLKELIALAKAKPDVINFASTGIGTSSHLAGELLKYSAGISMTHVPFKGSAPTAIALLAGDVQMTIDNITVFRPYYSTGRLRILGVSTLERLPAEPDIPTIAETVPEFEASAMTYVAITAGTPRPIIERLNGALNQILKMPEVVQRFSDDRSMPVGGTPENLAAVLQSERIKWKHIIELTGARAE